MKFALLFTTLVVWALWLGGSIATIVIGKHFFSVLPHDVAGPAANAMFHVFGDFELGLSAITIITTGAILATYPSKGFLVILGIFILAAGMTIAFTLGFIPLMDSLIEQGKQSSPEFIRLHIKSMIAMTIQCLLLLFNGAVMLASLLPARAKPSGSGFEVVMESGHG